ncbi:peptide/nickel transport system substrate-binding protein [Pedobacter westerhofensis]|uniref:Peptide/nickel transport system substrate-binding protein n=1 Tax=Pedobacter westerhofensis TaxID=425512 RepID=A0A521FQ59_9SPHI|nr:ABC transporter substrate-binding protein [Pedobacter westerhofensis]SMO98333.1 peptide/nickel transport system substrate-binding protein [Pedobacter westerhofensis]
MPRIIKNIFYTLCVIALYSCSRSADDDGKKVFNLNLDQNLTSMDPAFARNQYAIWMINQIFNGLVQIDSALNAVPAIAKSWEVSPDGLSYTFHLRNDISFQDDPLFKNGKGRKVIASDFVYSFNRLIDPKVGSSGGWIFSDKVTDIHNFIAVNDTTFKINLTKPFPAFLNLLCTQYCMVVPKEVVEHYGKDFRSHPVGTGPFRFKYWKEDEILVLLKNENYWEKENGVKLPYLDAVKVTFISDKQSAFMNFIKKDLDYFNSVDGTYRDDILTKTGNMTNKYKGKFQLIKAPYLNTEYVGILVDTSKSLVRNSPLRFKKVRQAINYGIDKAKLVKYLRNSIGVPATSGFVPKGMPGFDSTVVKGYHYDPAKAARLLAEAGYPNGKGMPEVMLTTSTSYKDLIEFIQGELSTLGMKVKVDVRPTASLRELMAKNEVNFFRGSWMADYPDAENYLSVFYSKNKVPFGPNYTGYFNKEFDRLFVASYYERDARKRYILNQRMDNMVIENASVVPILYDQSVTMLQNNISGYSINPLSWMILKRVKKK